MTAMWRSAPVVVVVWMLVMVAWMPAPVVTVVWMPGLDIRALAGRCNAVVGLSSTRLLTASLTRRVRQMRSRSGLLVLVPRLVVAPNMDTMAAVTAIGMVATTMAVATTALQELALVVLGTSRVAWAALPVVALVARQPAGTVPATATATVVASVVADLAATAQVTLLLVPTVVVSTTMVEELVVNGGGVSTAGTDTTATVVTIWIAPHGPKCRRCRLRVHPMAPPAPHWRPLARSHGTPTVRLSVAPKCGVLRRTNRLLHCCGSASGYVCLTSLVP